MIPPSVRHAVLARARRRCEDCGALVPLELHHLRYAPPMTELDLPGWESPDDLAALCRTCHHGRHLDPNGHFWADPQAMDDAWFGYHWEMDKA
jgi:5-methylcytosine-specific restriction endonuclease McrA